ncbi:MAG: type II toxin-antitoxin system death-on-curing family toxin [Cyclobacteriaceae bacterium]
MSSPSKIKWLDERVVLAVHSEQISRHGGLSGIRDEALLESALARPKNLSFYDHASIEKCAAAYIFGIVKNHPFQDGNKRTGFVAGITFLMLNGYYIQAKESDVVLVITKLAAGEMSEDQLSTWLSENLISI